MSKISELEASEAPEVIPDCPRCHKPLPLCVCDSITPIESRIELLILQHPQEQDRALGTARLTALHANFERLLARYRAARPFAPVKRKDWRRRKR